MMVLQEAGRFYRATKIFTGRGFVQIAGGQATGLPEIRRFTEGLESLQTV